MSFPWVVLLYMFEDLQGCILLLERRGEKASNRSPILGGLHYHLEGSSAKQPANSLRENPQGITGCVAAFAAGLLWTGSMIQAQVPASGNSREDLFPQLLSVLPAHVFPCRLSRDCLTWLQTAPSPKVKPFFLVVHIQWLINMDKGLAISAKLRMTLMGYFTSSVPHGVIWGPFGLQGSSASLSEQPASFPSLAQVWIPRTLLTTPSASQGAHPATVALCLSLHLFFFLFAMRKYRVFKCD